MSGPCAECGRINMTSPSDYFCSDLCQQHWYAKQTLGYPPAQEIASNVIPPAVRRWRAA
jgi:hypothetical protein